MAISSARAAPSSEPESNVLTNSATSSSESGSREIVVALRRPPPQLGLRSSSSSRARHTIKSGPWAQPARCSIRSSMPSSAQWMSSTAITSGRRADISSSSSRTAAKIRSRTSVPSAFSPAPSTPSRRAICEAVRVASAPSSPGANSAIPAVSFARIESGPSVRVIANRSLMISPSAAYAVAVP